MNEFKIKYNTNELSAEFVDIIQNNITYWDVIKLDNSLILNADEELQVNFNKYGLIPVFDAYDNDYICYQIKNAKWCMFNIVDEIAFKKDSTLQDLLNFKS